MAETLPLAEDLDGVNEVNQHDEGTEFHGASGAWAFLSKLRAKAREAQRQVEPSAPNSPSFSAVSYLRDPTDGEQASLRHSQLPVPTLQPDHGLERAAVLLYFDGLHVVHPFLDREAFLLQCEQKIWSMVTRATTGGNNHFNALYNMVLALGLITANQTSANLCDVGLTGDNPTPSATGAFAPPVQWAEFFFSRAKTNLGDIFHSTSIDATAALFLMSVYCQNALRPHSCYLYSGMAVRTALACGIASRVSAKHPWSSKLWWALFSHELEMCSSVGRETALASSEAYAIPLPRADPEAIAGLIECMVRFADIHRRISSTSYPVVASDLWMTRSMQAMEVEADLKLWKSSLGAALDYDKQSFTDSEWRLKQKLVLQLRYSNARILLHRPFFSCGGALTAKTAMLDHIRPCVDASISTIDVLYAAYTSRPWFRSWWYNTTYLLYAEMVILYILLSDVEVWPEISLREKAQQGLSTLESMKSNMVARECATVVREVLSIVTSLSDSRRNCRQLTEPMAHNAPAPAIHPSAQDALMIDTQETSLFGDKLLVEDCEDLFCNLADSSFLDDLLHTELWNMDTT
ncbi:hypothetical protein PRZ48_002693 [Zasmidium cellare]|uniref:Xylanolytic transcriptional activator regulatory domain-containing protein n=1 Tax=Zasmidium cellare TaxID=395010 RepID=A0ABR0EU62_ZASCE|nr:hypothetical protein PRZ48_002693 [Zasmidium cellare]